MDEQREELAERVRALLADALPNSDTREVAMFGARAFMIGEQMLVAANREGFLLVRLDAERHEEFLADPAAHQAEMGAGRSMGPGWINVERAGVESEQQLRFWIDVARARAGW